MSASATTTSETRLDRIETELGIDATTDQRGVADD
jgi:hypothetical protein